LIKLQLSPEIIFFPPLFEENKKTKDFENKTFGKVSRPRANRDFHKPNWSDLEAQLNFGFEITRLQIIRINYRRIELLPPNRNLGGLSFWPYDQSLQCTEYLNAKRTVYLQLSLNKHGL